MNFRLAFIIICLGLCIFKTAYSQLNSANLIAYSEKDGLPGAQVNNVLVDKLGYVWAGTINGLSRYDGYEFKRYYYNPNDTQSIHGLIVWSLLQDHSGKIWVGTSPSFLNVYDPASGLFSQYNFNNLISHSSYIEVNIRAMCEDNNGRIYFGADTYYGDNISSALLYKDANDDKLKRFITPDSLDIKNVIKLTKDKAGNICLLSYSGLFKIDTKRRLTKIHPPDKVHEYLTDINFDKNGHLWGVSESDKLYDLNLETGIYKIWSGTLRDTAKEGGFFLDRIVFDKDDNIWTGTSKGIQFFNRSTGTFSIFNNGAKKELEHVGAVDLAFDSFGTLWVGSLASGLIKYEERPQLKSFTYNKADKNSLTSGWANFIYESSDHKIWITTGGSSNTSGVNILDPATGNVKAIPFSTFSKRLNGVSGFWENSPGEMYLAVYNAVYSFSEKTNKIKPVKIAGVPDSTLITGFYKDAKNNEWICTLSKGLYGKINDSPVFKKYDLSLVKGATIASNDVSGVYESKKHGLWIITNNGLFLYDYNTGTIKRYGYDKKEGDVFITQDINSFYEDAEGIAWVGTWQGGLSRFNLQTKKIKTYTRDNGLPSMSVQGIIADEKNNALWLSTFDGLSRFNLQTEQFNNFSVADGIQSQLFADGSYLKTSGGLFAFGGSNGITIFNPDEITKNSLPPKVFLTDFKVFNKSIVPGEQSILRKPIYETDQITLAYNQNNISLNFIALHYSNPSKNRYAYKLENYDNDWREAGDVHEAFYQNLSPGEYVFHAKAANNNGVWNEKGVTLKITITPPWYKTAWAYVLYGLLAIALVFAVDKYLRNRFIRKERERSRARELEQAREIEKAYIRLEQTHQTLKATQAQLIQSEKMASLGELTAGIAHEIQNPLNFVNNFSEVNKELIDELKEEIKKGNIKEANAIADDLEANEEKINHHGRRADAIVKGMLQHSRVSTGNKEPTDINALADEYLRLSYHGLRAKDKSFNATLQTDFDDSIGKINIIPQDMGRVLLNLYNNAFYALLEKKQPQPLNGLKEYEPTVSVSTKSVRPLSGGLGVLISIKDNGSGIPQKIVDKIFQPFFTTKPAGQGTGLGLSLSYDIIKAHGGEIKVETKEGEGTEFMIKLPIV